MKESLELVITANKGLRTNWKTATARERLEELFTTETILKKLFKKKPCGQVFLEYTPKNVLGII